MATTLLRPDADVTTGWVTTPASQPTFEMLNDVVTQPTAPSTASDFVSAVNASLTFEVGLTTVPVSAVTQAVLWVYQDAPAGLGASTVYALYKGATQLASFTISATSVVGWASATYSGSLTQAEVDDLRIRATDTNSITGTFNVYAAYVELTYTPGGTTQAGTGEARSESRSTVKGALEVGGKEEARSISKAQATPGMVLIGKEAAKSSSRGDARAALVLGAKAISASLSKGQVRGLLDRIGLPSARSQSRADITPTVISGGSFPSARSMSDAQARAALVIAAISAARSESRAAGRGTMDQHAYAVSGGLSRAEAVGRVITPSVATDSSEALVVDLLTGELLLLDGLPSSGSASYPPLVIPEGESFTIPVNAQVLYADEVQVDGEIIFEDPTTDLPAGELVKVS